MNNAEQIRKIQKISQAKREEKNAEKERRRKIKSSKRSIINILDYLLLHFKIRLKAKNSKDFELWVPRELSIWVFNKLTEDGFDLKYYERIFGTRGATCIMWLKEDSK